MEGFPISLYLQIVTFLANAQIVLFQPCFKDFQIACFKLVPSKEFSVISGWFLSYFCHTQQITSPDFSVPPLTSSFVHTY